MGLAGLQGGYLRYNEPKGRIRVDFKPKMKKITWMVLCSGLVSVVACVCW